MTTLIKLALVLPLAFTVLMADKSCDIDLGDIGDYVVKYDINVINSTGQEVRIAIYGRDITASAIVPPGGEVAATSYQGGSAVINAQPSVDAVAELKSRKVDIETQLGQKPLSLTQAQTLYQELDQVNELLKTQPPAPAAVCFLLLKPDINGKGQEYDYDLKVGTDGKWALEGLCA